MKQTLDLDDAVDCKLAGLTLASIVASEAWPVITQLAAWIRERDLSKEPTDLVSLAALNGRNSGMQALLHAIKKLADASLTASPDKKPTAASVILGIRTSLTPGD